MRKPFKLFWIFLGLILLFYWIYLPVLTKYRELKIEEDRIAKELTDVTEKIRVLEEEKKLLKTDMAYLEKVIRTELGLVKPGETIYKFVNESPEPGTPEPLE